MTADLKRLQELIAEVRRLQSEDSEAVLLHHQDMVEAKEEAFNLKLEMQTMKETNHKLTIKLIDAQKELRSLRKWRNEHR